MYSGSLALSVIIPAYNESERIGNTLRSVDAYLKKQPYSYEIIVVDDGSKDSTVDVVRKHASYASNIKLLRLKPNQGKGWAVRSGMLQASGAYRLFMDADGATSIGHWEAMYEALENADVVVGSRHVDGSLIQVHQAKYREVLGALFRLIVRVICGLPIKDTQNGFKGFTAVAAERIFRKQHVAGWAFDVEILSIAQRLNYKIAEIPITWIDDDRSRMTLSAMPHMLLDLVRIRLQALQNAPAYHFGERSQLIQLS